MDIIHTTCTEMYIVLIGYSTHVFSTHNVTCITIILEWIIQNQLYNTIQMRAMNGQVNEQCNRRETDRYV